MEKTKKNQIEKGNAIVKISRVGARYTVARGYDDRCTVVNIMVSFKDSDYYRKQAFGFIGWDTKEFKEKCKEIIMTAITKAIDAMPQSFDDEKGWINFDNTIKSYLEFAEGGWTIGLKEEKPAESEKPQEPQAVKQVEKVERNYKTNQGIMTLNYENNVCGAYMGTHCIFEKNMTPEIFKELDTAVKAEPDMFYDYCNSFENSTNCDEYGQSDLDIFRDMVKYVHRMRFIIENL